MPYYLLFCKSIAVLYIQLEGFIQALLHAAEQLQLFIGEYFQLLERARIAGLLELVVVIEYLPACLGEEQIIFAVVVLVAHLLYPALLLELADNLAVGAGRFSVACRYFGDGCRFVPSNILDNLGSA